MVKMLVQLILGATLSACSLTASLDKPAPADLVLHNGAIYTMDAERSRAEAVAIRNGRIVYVGDSRAVNTYVGLHTQRVDLKGRMLLPSFQDVHVHPVYGGLAFTGCPLFEIRTLEEVMEHYNSGIKLSATLRLAFAAA